MSVTDITPEDRAADFVHMVLHNQLCGRVPGFPNADLFGSHDTAAAIVTRLLLGRERPDANSEPPSIIISSGFEGIRLRIGEGMTTLTYLQAVQFALDLIDTTQQGSVRGERLA